jgi:S-methylmethionine-dependent homocysteine/selenocysteine methylase
MTLYRSGLPQLAGQFFLTDGGIETTLIFQEGLDLPRNAAFVLLRDSAGRDALDRYFRGYIQLAKRFGAGLVLESATWRANPDWANQLGYTRDALAHAQRQSIESLETLRTELADESTPLVVSGCVGPRGDGYVPGERMTPREAQSYHADQINIFADTAADMVSAITINYAEEAIGVALAARAAGVPAAISFTVETDGALPTGQSLQDAVEQVEAATSAYPAYYMLNCAHPTHFQHVLESDEPWLNRLGGLRANASAKSHAELDEATEVDAGDPADLGRQYARLKERLPQLNVLGGCCGTDLRHIEQIATACRPLLSR